jgi:hypothetical protein
MSMSWPRVPLATPSVGALWRQMTWSPIAKPRPFGSGVAIRAKAIVSAQEGAGGVVERLDVDPAVGDHDRVRLVLVDGVPVGEQRRARLVGCAGQDEPAALRGVGEEVVGRAIP